MLKLGYKASAEQFGPSELLQFSRLAEQSGFESVFISDHFQPWKHHGGHAPFSLAWLGALGALTSRIIIGTSLAEQTTNQMRYYRTAKKLSLLDAFIAIHLLPNEPARAPAAWLGRARGR